MGVSSDWITRSRVVIVAGKGGVGTTTVSAALSLAAARRGLDVLLVAVDGKPGLGPLLGGSPITDRDQVLCRVPGGRVRGRSIPPQQAFADYLDLKGVGSLVRKAASAASLDMVAASTPGLEHLLVLGKVKELERTRDADLIVVDAPPAGHAAPFIRSARSLQEAVPNGPVRVQADEVDGLLTDHDRCQTVLVTLPEETPVNEVIELADDIGERIGVHLGPVVANACWPDDGGLRLTPAAAAKKAGLALSAADKAALTGSSRFGEARLRVQREQLDRLTAALATSVVRLPRLAVPRLTADHIRRLADALADTTEIAP